MSEKLSRLGTRLQNPAWRKYGATLLIGKFLGLFLVLAMMATVAIAPRLLSSSAQAEPATQPVEAAPATAPGAVTMPTMAATTESATGATTTAATPDPYATAKGGDIINPLNTVWTLIAAFLVFAMQVGFTMLEAGFCRSRETVNVLVECVFDTCLCGILYWAWGYAFMFGAGNGFIGWHDPNDTAAPYHNWFFLQNITQLADPAAGAPTAAKVVTSLTYGTSGVPILAHWVFQFAFADCASTICSGTMIGRTAFWGDIIYSVFVSGFIYPIIGHWAWGPDGLLYTMGGQNTPTDLRPLTHVFTGLGMNFHDFAGSTVVHSIGGWIALAGGIMLGPRIGRRFKRDGGGPMLPHDLTVAVCGGLLLWFGWYGFNPGSTLSAMDFSGIARVAANTTLAAATGGLAACFFMYFRIGKWDAGAITNGFLAGLVAITCPCYWVSPLGAAILGAIAGIIVILGVDLLEFLRIDDPIGAWPVHGLCGIWGTLSLGLFASGEYNAAGSSPTSVPVVGLNAPEALRGLFYGGGAQVLEAQIIGSATICIATFVCAMIVFGILKAVGLLRISREGELEGMDIHEHGISAYPEYVISALAAPAGMARDTVGTYPQTGVVTGTTVAPAGAK